MALRLPEPPFWGKVAFAKQMTDEGMSGLRRAGVVAPYKAYRLPPP